MEYVEPPPAPKPEEEKSKEKFLKIPMEPDMDREIVFQKAKVGDVHEILELINWYATANIMLPRGPQYLYENIRDFVIASDQKVPVYSLMETREKFHLIVACGSLHVLWDDIAEIRALAIHPEYQQLGLGGKLVEHLKAEAKKLGIRRLYVFTLTEKFFSKLGFTRQKRNELPAKVWGECSRCPKYFHCDEIGMAMDL